MTRLFGNESDCLLFAKLTAHFLGNGHKIDFLLNAKEVFLHEFLPKNDYLRTAGKLLLMIFSLILLKSEKISITVKLNQCSRKIVCSSLFISSQKTSEYLNKLKNVV